jgi:hypothetical protein
VGRGPLIALRVEFKAHRRSPDSDSVIFGYHAKLGVNPNVYGQLVVEYATVCFRRQEDFGPRAWQRVVTTDPYRHPNSLALKRIQDFSGRIFSKVKGSA